MPRSLQESGSRFARAAVPVPQSRSRKHPGPPEAHPHCPPASHRVVREGRPARVAARGAVLERRRGLAGGRETGPQETRASHHGP